MDACRLRRGGIAVAMPSQAAEPVTSQPTGIIATPPTGDGAPEAKITVDGSSEHVPKARQAPHIDAGTVHRTRNPSGRPLGDKPE
ncbi:MAG TPA: hypothetical protein VEI03_19105 [Stellaceae bacterium]|nr:hypothetical protein [Stellaceae bacterium]